MNTCTICKEEKNNGFIFYNCNHINCFICINKQKIKFDNLKNCKMCSNEQDVKQINNDFVNSSQYLALFKKDMTNYNIFM